MLWKALYPTQWTRGVWSFDYTPPIDTDIPQVVTIAQMGFNICMVARDAVKMTPILQQLEQKYQVKT